MPIYSCPSTLDHVIVRERVMLSNTFYICLVKCRNMTLTSQLTISWENVPHKLYSTRSILLLLWKGKEEYIFREKYAFSITKLTVSLRIPSLKVRYRAVHALALAPFCLIYIRTYIVIGYQYSAIGFMLIAYMVVIRRVAEWP